MSNRRTARAAAALAVAAALALPTPPAAAADELPPGWEVRPGTDDRPAQLSWNSPEPLRMGGAPVEISLGDHALGPATVAPNGTRATVDLPPSYAGADAEELAAAVAEADPQVSKAGRDLTEEPPRITGEQAEQLTEAAHDLRAELRSFPTVAHDPGTPGTFEVTEGDYAGPDVRLPGLSVPVETEAHVVAPVVPNPDGQRRPLVVLLHGRHTTCYPEPGSDGGSGDVASDDPRFAAWPCADGWRPVPSQRGYVQTQRLLASRGFVTVSIASNGINGQDLPLDDGGAGARAALIDHHLDLWDGWSRSSAAHASAPPAVAAAPMADLDRIMLVGHSRGGDGVNRAALDARASTERRVRGVVHLAPTLLGRNPAPDVPTVVLLPSCDGDVQDLQGQEYVDSARDLAGPGEPGPALRSSVLVLGANHNWFNSEWTPGSAAPSWDDWYNPADPLCGTGSDSIRLSPAEQRQVGATYVAAAAAVFLEQDAEVLPLLDGARVRAASAGPAGVTTHAIGGRRVPLLVPDADTPVTSSGSLEARICRTSAEMGDPVACQPFGGAPGPHFLPFTRIPGEPSRSALRLDWPAGRSPGNGGDGTGTALDGTEAATVRLPAPVSIAGRDALDLRMLSRAGLDGATRFGIRLTDARGTSLDLGSTELLAQADDRSGASLRAQDVRFRLDNQAVGSAGFDLSSVASITLLPESGYGRLWLLDAWAWRSGGGTDSGSSPATVRVDVSDLTVADAADDRQITLPISVSGAGSEPAQVWVGVRSLLPDGVSTGSIVTIPAGGGNGNWNGQDAGTRTVSVQVPVRGDAVGSGAESSEVDVAFVYVLGVRGASVGEYTARLTIRDDEHEDGAQNGGWDGAAFARQSLPVPAELIRPH